MITRSKLMASVLLSAVLGGSMIGCGDERRGNDRWATTENTNVEIDWDKVNEAYKQAEGPADLERRINEIYEGDEIISVHVQDVDDKTQVVTGFFDKNTDGQIADAEKVFTITRKITGEGQAEAHTQGYGYYAGYHSPVMSIMTGMLLGSMVSSMFTPGYAPMYSRAYVTSPQRYSELHSQRSGYRASNPSRFSKPSQTGRKYGGSTFRGGSPGRSRGGGRFGIRRAAGAPRPTRLEA